MSITMIIIVFIIPMLLCFYIGYYIYKDNWDNYLAGGSTEIVISILVGFMPIVNWMFCLLIGGKFLIERLKCRNN